MHRRQCVRQCGADCKEKSASHLYRRRCRQKTHASITRPPPLPPLPPPRWPPSEPLSQQRGSTWTAAGRKKGAGHREKDKEFIDTESFRRYTGEVARIIFLTCGRFRYVARFWTENEIGLISTTLFSQFQYTVDKVAMLKMFRHSAYSMEGIRTYVATLSLVYWN